MQKLKDRIRREGKVLPGNIIKVDGFLNHRVLIVDDFMANGEAVRGLCDIVSQAGAELVGVGIAVEKGFQGGGDRLRAAGVPYHALAVIDRADEDGIVFRDEA